MHLLKARVLYAARWLRATFLNLEMLGVVFGTIVGFAIAGVLWPDIAPVLVFLCGLGGSYACARLKRYRRDRRSLATLKPTS